MELGLNLQILNIAFYRFVQLTDLVSLRQLLTQHCQDLKLKGSILLSPEGVNGYLAGPVDSVRGFQKFLNENPLFGGIDFKESKSNFIPYQRLRIKLKKEIIATGDSSVQPKRDAVPRVSPQTLKKWLDEQQSFQLLDTRNDYEVEHGSFSQAIHLGLKHFRDFAEKMEKLPLSVKNRPWVVFCTGGIRCEKAGILAKRYGVQEVYQLEGGILNYFKECGGSHYQGGCFVFDERVALDSDLKPIVAGH